MLAKQPLRLGQAGCRPHFVISVAQNGFYSLEHRNIVIHKQNSRTPRGNRFAVQNQMLRSGRSLVRQLNSETRPGRLQIAYPYGATMFADDSVTYAQAKSGALSHRLRGVERIEHAGSIFHARAAVLELHNQASINGLRADPEVAILRVFQDRIYRVVHQIQKHLLKLVRVRGGHGQIGSQIIVNANVAEAEVVIAQRQRVLQYLVELHCDSLRLVLARETQKILDDSMGPLRLLIELVRVFHALSWHLAAG